MKWIGSLKCVAESVSFGFRFGDQIVTDSAPGLIIIKVGSFALLVVLIEGGVEGHRIGLEVDLLDEGGRFGATVHAVHATVFPFD